MRTWYGRRKLCRYELAQPSYARGRCGAVCFSCLTFVLLAQHFKRTEEMQRTAWLPLRYLGRGRRLAFCFFQANFSGRCGNVYTVHKDTLRVTTRSSVSDTPGMRLMLTVLVLRGRRKTFSV